MVARRSACDGILPSGIGCTRAIGRPGLVIVALLAQHALQFWQGGPDLAHAQRLHASLLLGDTDWILMSPVSDRKLSLGAPRDCSHPA